MIKAKCVTAVKGEYDYIDAVNVDEYNPKGDYELISNGKRGENRAMYVNKFGTFDIETTSITHTEKEKDGDTYYDKDVADYAYMYAWTACIDGVEVYGRTWDEFIRLLIKLNEYYQLSAERRFVIYVHNLSFEYAFLNGYVNVSNLFATGRRKVLYMRLAQGIELRCSYRLTNMSLDSYLRKTPGVRHVKGKGELDYSKIRTFESELTETEWGYCVNDTLGLWEALTITMRRDKDTVTTIPATSTGYVRRDMKRSILRSNARELIKKLAPTEEIYKMLKEAQRGGDTHCNRTKAGKIVVDVESDDATSEYPSVQMLYKFPVNPFKKVKVNKKIFRQLAGRPFLMRIALCGVEMQPHKYDPYLSISKVRNEKNVHNDNGRVWCADYLETTITDVDWEIVRDTYDIEKCYVLGDVYASYYDYLPKYVTEVIMEYFKGKTLNKQKIKKTLPGSVEREDAEYDTQKSKNKLNAIYGMSATDPIHKVYRINAEGEWIESESEAPFTKSVENAVLPLQWGVWTTAWGRYHLHRMLNCALEPYYWDTDSCKSEIIDHEAFKKLNDDIKKKCDERGAYCDTEKGRVYMGIFENESEIREENAPKYSVFLSWGAKKYCGIAYTDKDWVFRKDGSLNFETTISGVGKKEGEAFYKTPTNFKPGTRIPNSGGNNVSYKDNPTIERRLVRDYEGKTSEVEYAGFACLTKRTYKLDITLQQRLDYVHNNILN